MNPYDIDKAYVSPYDKFLYEFDAQHSPSDSQQKEIKKHQRLAALRDNPSPETKDKSQWIDF